MTATIRLGPRRFTAIATLSAFGAAFIERPSPGLQFLLDRLDELYGFKLAVNGHAALLQVAPGQDGDLVSPVLPLHIASISLLFEDPGDCHVRVSAIDEIVAMVLVPPVAQNVTARAVAIVEEFRD